MSDIDTTQLRRLDMTLLLVLAELVRHRKMTVVAERLGLTQSAISHSLKRLRDIFGDELFLRRPAGLEPTGRAMALEPKIAAILSLTSSALDMGAAFDHVVEQRTVRIAALDYEEVMFAAPLIERMRRVAPGILLAFRSLTREAALEAMADGALDVSLGYFFRLERNFASQELYKESYRVVMRRRHPLTRGRLTLKRYAAADHLLVSLAGDLRGIVDVALAQHDLERRVVASVPLFLPALATVARTDLISTVPTRLALRYGRAYDLAVLPSPVDIRPFSVHMAWHRRTTTEPAMMWFRNELQEVVCSAASESGRPAAIPRS